MEIVSYGGWQRCARLVHDNLELIVTLDVGPRIIRFGFVGGPNEFVEIAENMGKSGSDGFVAYGGHRLWVAPEISEITLQPDNSPVEATTEAGEFVFTTSIDRWHVQKQIRVTFPRPGLVKVEHRVYNRGAHNLDLASWALSQMAPKGKAYFPMPTYKAHTEEVLPDRPMALWSYTDLADPRWTWSQSMGALQQDPTRGSQKMGMFCGQGYAAYANHGHLFLKAFEVNASETHPDFGCNFETFTNERFLELESLGPIRSVASDDFTGHSEWWMLEAEPAPTDFERAVTRVKASAAKLLHERTQ